MKLHEFEALASNCRSLRRSRWWSLTSLSRSATCKPDISSGVSKHRRCIAAIWKAIASLARAGNYTAVSAAGHQFSEFVDAFDGVMLVSDGLRCDLHVLVEREQRSGRWAGIAAASLGVHDGWRYDLSFDTTSGPDPIGMAKQVLAVASARSNEAQRE
jgi:chloramphenicol 3-O-phosphotransferase